MVLFLPPIWITRLGSEAVGLPLIYGVPLSLAASFLPILLLGASVTLTWPRWGSISDVSTVLARLGA